eukprot:1159773-Pelagomonas_calceolata.AAC.1
MPWGSTWTKPSEITIPAAADLNMRATGSDMSLKICKGTEKRTRSRSLGRKHMGGKFIEGEPPWVAKVPMQQPTFKYNGGIPPMIPATKIAKTLPIRRPRVSSSAPFRIAKPRNMVRVFLIVCVAMANRIPVKRWTPTR